MRHLRVRELFSQWVLPVRCIGLVICVVGFGRIVHSSDAMGILVAAIGSLVWQAGTLLKERSPFFRLVSTTLAREVMRTKRLDLPGHLIVAKLWERLGGLSEEMFFVTTQDGYQSGIVVSEQLCTMSRDDGHYMSVAQVAQPISCAESIRDDDSVLAALTEMERHRRDYVTVLDRYERLVGVLTRKEVARLVASRRPVVGRERLEFVGSASKPFQPIGSTCA
jgi:hypothetical protein